MFRIFTILSLFFLSLQLYGLKITGSVQLNHTYNEVTVLATLSRNDSVLLSTTTDELGVFEFDADSGLYQLRIYANGDLSSELQALQITRRTTLPRIELNSVNYCPPNTRLLSGKRTFNCDIIVAENDTMRIAAGSELYFTDGNGFVVHGVLLAEGTSNNPIRMKNSSMSSWWKGIRLSSGAYLDLKHTQIENTNRTAIVATSATVNISACTIRNSNQQELNELNIQAGSTSMLEATNCNISIANSTITNKTCSSCNNSTAISIATSQLVLQNTLVEEFTSNGLGAGVYASGSEVFIINCDFIGNRLLEGNGSCVYVDENEANSLTVINSIFYNNYSRYSPCIFNTLSDVSLELSNNIFYGNKYGTYPFQEADTYDNILDFTENTVTNSDSTGGDTVVVVVPIIRNISDNKFEDPLFLDTVSYNLHPLSPGVDEGIPSPIGLPAYTENTDGNFDGVPAFDIGIKELLIEEAIDQTIEYSTTESTRGDTLYYYVGTQNNVEYVYTVIVVNGNEYVLYNYTKINDNPLPDSVEAGSSAIVCPFGTHQLNDANAWGYTSVEWFTSGNGEFSNNYALNPTYTPGSSDRDDGEVILTLRAYNGNENYYLEDRVFLQIRTSAYRTIFLEHEAVVCKFDTIFSTSPPDLQNVIWNDTLHSNRFQKLALNDFIITIRGEYLGCMYYDTAFITVPQVDASFSYSENDLELSLTANIPSYPIHNWLINDVESLTGASTKYIFQESDYYAVCHNVEDENGCHDTVCEEIFISPKGFYIGGQVFAGFEPIDTGIATLYRFTNNNYSFFEQQEFSTYGYYSFSVPEGSYIIKIALKPESVFFGEFRETYFGDVFYQINAEHISVSQNTWGKDINLIPTDVSLGSVSSLEFRMQGTELNIHMDITDVKIYASNGTAVKESSKPNIDISDLAKGCYLIEAHDENGTLYSGFFVK